MSYQVLARKWRPNRFGELVGQEHVVTAISNALDNNRLHHAYLFTGTRGVGKTTIARIFSKSLNCEQGLSAKPCGQCSTCKEIENGNFIDLLEIDAASRTKVEDTRELLDNVQYKPSRGRYKVYLIDEVHMLSKHSFNALLKTLEEPPPHVKFLLATTDPQKLPVTILSRCLQFNLKALSRSQISQQLDFVLGEEGIEFDKEALNQLARAAQGSMRDALSLTDQAIAQGNGVVGIQIVTDMLGLMDKNQVLKLVHSVVQKDSEKVMQQVEFMANQAPDYGLVLAEIMSLFHQIALTQFVPDACKLETISARAIFQLAQSVPAEQIQLLYQIALTGKKDLPHAADARTGLEMTLLRMLAFCPNNVKLDALDIVALTPDVEVVLQQPTSQATDNVTLGSLSTDPITHNANDLINQSEPLQEPIVEGLALQNGPVEVIAENSPVLHQEFSAEPSSEHSQEHSPELSPEPKQDQSRQPQNDQATLSDVELFAQQQDIMAQAENFGHQPIDYDQYQPVSLEEQQYPGFDSEHKPSGYEDHAMHTQPTQESSHQQTDTKPNTSTAELIALRNKLKQSQREEGEGAEQVKKSESSAPFNLAAIRKQNQEAENKSDVANDKKPSQDIQPPSDPISEPQLTSSSADHVIDNIPPWPVENESPASPTETPVVTTLLTTAVSPFSAEKTLQEAEYFDSYAHLDEENVGDVTLEVTAFLPNKQKVLKALQIDAWSKLIEDMQVTALTKQLALHSAFNQQGNTVKLTLLETKAHLISDTAQQQLKDALCFALNGPIDLEIELGKPINTPYALQLKVNQVRNEYAREVVKGDPGIQLLQQQFAAKVDEQSIQAR
ncbi:DNA polymerase III subunit gamma/tau [Paraglaciecola sp. MB-3u-78]|uniref:DNA polymerase III subunit gamma/tau n=1 Tax=Paraglaciecola sp. MB-3u-78 TaxID=2058332 RepID=UPI000C335992|nr:DNA polymerase III subunit gamma/tau [Paraglaciecola sp. MB-3u-78]PKH00475.1 DNA polymerase III subunit gamma/tau [Paraglaciecola sp. MB-3u-78]